MKEKGTHHPVRYLYFSYADTLDWKVSPVFGIILAGLREHAISLR